MIPVYNQPLYTRICLASLELADLAEAAVIAVDNGSDAETARVLQAWESAGPRRTHLRFEENRGFAHACNAGAGCANAGHVVFLNNDTFVERDWLPRLLAAFGDESTAVAGSRLLYPSGHVQHAGIAFDERAPHHVFVGLPGDHPAVLEPRRCQAVTGAAMAVSQAWFERLGGFDESYRNSFEDIDLCLRAGEQGGRVLYAPDSVAYHFEGASQGRIDNDDSNYERFIARWRGRWRVDLPGLLADAHERHGLQYEFPRHRESADREARRERRLAELEAENAELRRLAGMRSVRAALRMRNLYRSLFPSRNRH